MRTSCTENVSGRVPLVWLNNGTALAVAAGHPPQTETRETLYRHLTLRWHSPALFYAAASGTAAANGRRQCRCTRGHEEEAVIFTPKQAARAAMSCC